MHAFPRKFFFRSVPLLIATFILAGCASSPENPNTVKGEPFHISSVIKTDIDLVTETHQRVVFDTLERLAVKLYKRNPNEWRKSGHVSLEMAVKALTADPFPEINGKRSIDCIRLAFEESYRGDRVKAFVAGLETMVLDAYDGDRTFYLLDFPNAQSLYNSARNIEVASWLIRTRRNSRGELFLLSSEDHNQINLSFERLFGKLINAQDMIAQIVADRTHRGIKTVIQSVATAFIPI
ncbi:MAG: hypothetical protein ACU833_00860 [Gammaproteobacteria bacterium]